MLNTCIPSRTDTTICFMYHTHTLIELGILVTNFTTTVRTSIIYQNYLKIFVSLSENTVHTSSDKPF